VTAGASAPEQFVRRVIDYLRLQGAELVEELDADDEDVHFAIPAQLQGAKLTT
jgi:hypothetical protein